MAKFSFKLGNIEVTDTKGMSFKVNDIVCDTELSLQDIVQYGEQGMKLLTELKNFVKAELPDVMRNCARAQREIDAERIRFNKEYFNRISTSRVIEDSYATDKLRREDRERDERLKKAMAETAAFKATKESEDQ